VRLRVDGECVQYKSIPYAYRSALVSRLKIMANLDITEHRRPQDGKIRFHFEDKVLELRVATIPTTSGCEDVVMRLLPPAGAMPFTQLELTESNATRLRQLMSHSYGLILCVGPTGSGKTTTLHAVLRELNTPDMKIWTAEDPVEITQAGLRQVQVAPKIGFDFATALRAFLRADPDIIMVGEMRDRETANIAIEASLTGHLVLSTLHTNTAPETITRLLELGIDAFGFADSLLGVLAQRLARRLCVTCRRQRPASGAERAWLDEATAGRARAASGAKGSDLELWDAVGCERCAGSGYSGRIALHELLVTDDGIRDAILKHQAITEVRHRAQAGGMTTLLQDGVAKAIAGHTDLRQVRAVCTQ
jgi:type II secretory ATPase GspE/PulE/Tfp pilus assembly ATPase PilB-like protein